MLVLTSKLLVLNSLYYSKCFLLEHLQSLGLLKGYQVFSEGGDWEDPTAIDKSVIAGNLIRAIANGLIGKQA